VEVLEENLTRDDVQVSMHEVVDSSHATMCYVVAFAVPT
jgi:hypothetical protein